MAPKKPVIKKEPGAELCVKGMQGKDLANAIGYKIRKSPAWLREYYEGKIKYSKTKTSDDKRKFVEELLAADEGFTSRFWEHIKETTTKEIDSKDYEWMSWKKLVGEEDEAVIRLMIDQKQILTRPHDKLDHTKQETLALPWEKRTQFKHIKECGSSSIEDMTKLARMDDRPPAEAPPPEPEQAEGRALDTVDIKKTMSKIRKLRSQWTVNEPDVMQRLQSAEKCGCDS